MQAYQLPEVQAMIAVIRTAARREGVSMVEVRDLYGNYDDPRGLVFVCARLGLDPNEVLAAGQRAADEHARQP